MKKGNCQDTIGYGLSHFRFVARLPLSLWERAGSGRNHVQYVGISARRVGAEGKRKEESRFGKARVGAGFRKEDAVGGV